MSLDENKNNQEQVNTQKETKVKASFGDSMGDFNTATSALTSITGAVKELASALRSVVEQATMAAFSISSFEKLTGLSGVKLQEWQCFAERANVSVGAVTASIISLQNKLAGGRNSNLFASLGIDKSQDAFGVLDQLHEKIKGMKQQDAEKLLDKLGLSPDMIRILSLTDEEFKKLSKDMSRVKSEKEVKAFIASKEHTVRFNQAVRGVNDSVAAGLLPTMVKSSDRLTGAMNYITAGDALKGAVNNSASGIYTVASFAGFGPGLTMMTAVKKGLNDIDTVAGQVVNKFKKFVIPAHTLAELTGSKKGGSSVFTNLITKGPIGTVIDSLGKAGNIVINITQHINSNGEPKAVGDHVAGSTGKEFSRVIATTRRGGN